MANEGNITVALDITVTPELLNEGIAREIVNRVQNIRKDRQYDITDKIDIVIESTEFTDSAVKEFADYISKQVLANSLVIGEICGESEENATLDIDEQNINVRIALSK